MTQDDFRVLEFLANRLAGTPTNAIQGVPSDKARASLLRLETAGLVEKLGYKQGNVSLWRATSEGNRVNFNRSTIGRNAELG